MGYIVYHPLQAPGNWYSCRASDFPSDSYGMATNIRDAQIYKTRVGAEKRAARLTELDFLLQRRHMYNSIWKVRKYTPKSS